MLKLGYVKNSSRLKLGYVKRCKNFELPFLQSTQATMDYAKQKAILMAQLKMSSGVKPARKNQVNRRMTNVHIS